MNKYIHCCFESSSKLSDDNNVYSCGKCQFKFPSVCTLYKHLLEDEAMTEFVFRNDDKTAYEFNVQNKCSDLKDHSVADDDEEDYDVDLNLHNDTGTLTNHSERLFVEVEKNIRPGITENSMRNKRLKSEFDRTAASIVNTEPCSATNGEPDLMNASLDDFADKIEETCSVSHVVNPNSKGRKSSERAVDTFYPCEVCGGIYKYDSLSIHKAVHAKRTLQCDQCNLKFSSKARLNQHKTFVHATEKKYTCHECGKSFKALPYLRQHGKKHLKERTAECALCHKKFKDQKAVRVHMISHSEERPYKCYRCEKSFKRAKDLEIHEEGVHLAIEKYPCVECNKKFKTRSAVRKHMLIHKPPKHFCEVCGKSFSQHSNMIIHQKIHSKGV